MSEWSQVLFHFSWKTHPFHNIHLEVQLSCSRWSLLVLTLRAFLFPELLNSGRNQPMFFLATLWPQFHLNYFLSTSDLHLSPNMTFHLVQLECISTWLLSQQLHGAHSTYAPGRPSLEFSCLPLLNVKNMRETWHHIYLYTSNWPWFFYFGEGEYCFCHSHIDIGKKGEGGMMKEKWTLEQNA